MEKSKRDNLLIIAMLVVATALITFCLPSKNFRNLDYRQGQAVVLSHAQGPVRHPHRV